MYLDQSLQLTARSANSYVVVQVLLDTEATKKLDLLQPLPPQVPALSAVMTDVLASLH